MREFISSPLHQALLFTLLSLAALPIVRPKDADSAYAIAGAFYAVFIVVNSFLLWTAPKAWPYFFQSMLLSIAYLLVAALVVALYLGVTKTKGPNDSAMVFLVIVYHPFALLAAIFLQWAARWIRAW